MRSYLERASKPVKTPLHPYRPLEKASYAGHDNRGPMKEEYTQTQFTIGLVESPIPLHFFIVTGHNPFGRVAPDEENGEMNEILRQQLANAGWMFFGVTGHCEDHAEDGYGIVCSREDAILLGQEFQQDAIYEVLDDQVLLVDCKEEEEDVYVGRWSELLAPRS